MIADAIRPDRIERRLDELAAIGATDAGGVTRPAYSERETAAFEYVVGELPDGFAVEHDAIGNLYATPSPNADRTVLVGSHLDSVYDGGRLDGALGVVVALEAIEAAMDAGDAFAIPPTLTVFRAEESARFGRGTVGSRGAVGKLPAEDLDAEDADGVALREAMREAGFEPPTPGEPTIDLGRAAAYLETHIEQGPVLESEGTNLAIVTSIRAPVRYRVTVEGEYDHSGATPMDLRRDAIACAGEMVTAVEERGTAGAREGNLVATVTEFDAVDTAANKICGRVAFTIDLRSNDLDYRDAVEDRLLDELRAVADRRGVGVETESFYRQEPVTLPDHVVEALEGHADAVGASHRRLPSGGGHDGRQTQSAGVPSGMLFVPSFGGVSHTPEEETDPDAVADAAAVFARALVEGL